MKVVIEMTDGVGQMVVEGEDRAVIVNFTYLGNPAEAVKRAFEKANNRIKELDGLLLPAINNDDKVKPTATPKSDDNKPAQKALL